MKQRFTTDGGFPAGVLRLKIGGYFPSHRPGNWRLWNMYVYFLQRLRPTRTSADLTGKEAIRIGDTFSHCWTCMVDGAEWGRMPQCCDVARLLERLRLPLKILDSISAPWHWRHAAFQSKTGVRIV